MGENLPDPRTPIWQRFLIGRRPSTTIIRAALLAILLIVFFQFILIPTRVNGISMAPTYRHGQFNLINAVAYKFSEPRRGDVVAVRTSGKSVLYLKRIVGLPGEEVAIRGGTVYIDGEPLEEPYVAEDRQPWEMEPVQLDGNQYYVIGDNRSMSSSDHDFGAFDQARIVGKAFLN